MDPLTSAPKVNRLTDIEPIEVSVVDHAANMKKFVIVKAEAGVKKNGSEVRSDGKGGLTVVKDDATATPPTTPAPATTPTTPVAPPAEVVSPGLGSASVLRISPEVKAELAKRVAVANARLTELTKMLDGATVEAGIVEVPAGVIASISEILIGLAEGDVEKSETTKPLDAAIAPTLNVVAKGLAQFSTTRVTALRAAHDAIGSLLDAVAPTVIAPPPTVADPIVDPVVTPPAVDGNAEMLKHLAALETGVASNLAKMVAIVESQNATIKKSLATIPERRASNGPPIDAPIQKNDDAEGSASWPSDMSNPDKFDPKKATPDIRFTR